MAAITENLNAEVGDPSAAAELMPLVHEQLWRLARLTMAHLPPGQTLQPTALVNEAFLKLARQPEGIWKDRRHFYHVAAEAMRQIIIDRARRKQRLRRGGDRVAVDIDAVEIAAPIPNDDAMLLALDEALIEFERVQPEKARIVKLKFYVGLTNAQVAGELDMGERTVKQHWSYARAWLFDRIKKLR